MHYIWDILIFFRLTRDKAPLHQANLEKRGNLMLLVDALIMIYLQKVIFIIENNWFYDKI